ncbi:hypothetical protein B0H11DRAFT_2239627 [Mycena galericulata]|nr:hypothetical protein B0H11DRAFT_2239627 [Mycena galericulata]
MHVNPKSVFNCSISAALIDLVAGLAITSSGRSNMDLFQRTSIVSFPHNSWRRARVTHLWIEGFAEWVGGTLAFTPVPIKKDTDAEGDTERAHIATGPHNTGKRKRCIQPLFLIVGLVFQRYRNAEDGSVALFMRFLFQ